MSPTDRLLFFTTLFSAYSSRRQASFDTVFRWLELAKLFQHQDARWSSLTEQLNHSLENVLAPDLRRLIEVQVQEMAIQGIDVVTRRESNYPQALRNHLEDRAPLFLWFRGNSKLLSKLSVCFCGSRHASELGLEVCRDIVTQLVGHDLAVVAGYAAGVDQVAHLTALRNGGETVAVLAEGILNFSIRQTLSKDWQWDRALVVSEFLPQKRWSVAQAMQRNRTIVGLGCALVVIEAGESGGTFEAGKEALALRHPLFAPIYGSLENNVAGNKILITRGATPIMKSKSTGRAKLDPLLDAISSDQQVPTEAHSSEARYEAVRNSPKIKE